MFVAFKPSKDADPVELFATLLTVPRPSATFTWRGWTLQARALSSLELSPIARDTNTRQQSLLIATLRMDGEPVFQSLDEFSSFYGNDLDTLHDLASAALDRVSPTYAFSQVSAWHEFLVEGLRNRREAWCTVHALGNSIDVTPLGTVVERPDRFFGVPLNQLVDAHWIAFRAARSLVTEASRE